MLPKAILTEKLQNSLLSVAFPWANTIIKSNKWHQDLTSRWQTQLTIQLKTTGLGHDRGVKAQRLFIDENSPLNMNKNTT